MDKQGLFHALCNVLLQARCPALVNVTPAIMSMYYSFNSSAAWLGCACRALAACVLTAHVALSHLLVQSRFSLPDLVISFKPKPQESRQLANSMRTINIRTNHKGRLSITGTHSNLVVLTRPSWLLSN